MSLEVAFGTLKLVFYALSWFAFLLWLVLFPFPGLGALKKVEEKHK